MLTTLASRNTWLSGRVLTSSALRADKQHESGKENARAPSDCHECYNLQATDPLKSRIANGIDDRREAGDQRKHQADDHSSHKRTRGVPTRWKCGSLPDHYHPDPEEDLIPAEGRAGVREAVPSLVIQRGEPSDKIACKCGSPTFC